MAERVALRFAWAGAHLLLALFVFLSGHAWAATLDVSRMTSESVLLAEYFSVKEDIEGKLTLDEISREHVVDHFGAARPAGNFLNFGFTRSTYWLRLRVSNSSGQPVKRMLQISHALLSHIELYQPAADGHYQAVVTGVAEPFASRPHANRFFVFPITVPAHSKQAIYLRIQSTIVMQIPARLWEPQAFQASERDDYVFQAWYFGMAAALILFNLFLFIGLRESVYLSYVVFSIFHVLTIAAGNGWGKEFVWPDTTWWSDIAVSVLGAFTQAALLMFMRQLLDTRELVPRLDRLIRVFIGIHLLLSVGFVVSIRGFTVPGARVVLATMLLVLFVGLYCTLVKKQRMAMFFMVAFLMWILGNVVVGLRGLGVLPTNAFTMNGWQLGSALEMLVLAFALAYRFNQIRRKADDDVRQVNLGLESRLQIREAELTRTHKLLVEIERRQALSKERQRLMQDMHDGMGSSLTGALRLVERGKLDKDELTFLLRSCIDDLKLAIDSFESVDDDLLLLLATLRFRMGPRLEASGIVLRWNVREVPPLKWLDHHNALHILRILQEAFTNVIKHSKATEVTLSTEVQGECVLVTITDNGPGFSVAQALENGGRGLTNQQRRADAIGAVLWWDSGAGGTTMSLQLPIDKPRLPEAQLA